MSDSFDNDFFDEFTEIFKAMVAVMFILGLGGLATVVFLGMMFL